MKLRNGVYTMFYSMGCYTIDTFEKVVISILLFMFTTVGFLAMYYIYILIKDLGRWK